MKFWKISYGVAFFLLLIGVVKFSIPTSYNCEKVDSYIYADGAVSDDEITLAESYVEALPSELLSYFTDNNWKVVITSDIDNKVIGRTIPSEKVVLIKEGYVFQALWHEFGHMYLMQHPYDSSFDNLYEEEGRTLITEFYGEADVNYWLEDETEYWCQAFQTVRVANEQVSGVAPKTYAYFADIFNQLYSGKSAN